MKLRIIKDKRVFPLMLFLVIKLLELFCVIPFYSLIGEQGGALYGYAYIIFIILSSFVITCIPMAIHKIVLEYQTLGYYKIKKRALNLSRNISLFFGFLLFLFTYFCAPYFVKVIFGNLIGVNLPKYVISAIRMVSYSFLIVPVLNVYRGYFKGHHLDSSYSYSYCIESFITNFVMIVGCSIASKSFHFSTDKVVFLALLGIFLGNLFSFCYLLFVMRRNKRFHEAIRPVNEPIISNQIIIKKVFQSIFLFAFIDFLKVFCNAVDLFTVLKIFVYKAYFSIQEAEEIYSILSIWGQYFNWILISISMVLTTKIILQVTENLGKKKNIDVQTLVMKVLTTSFFVLVPLTLVISFLSKAIWTLFYGNNIHGSSLLAYYIFVGLFASLYMAIVMILKELKNYKSIFISFIIGFIFKILFNHSLIYSFYQMGFPAYYGVITASILAYIIPFLYCLIVLTLQYKISFEIIVKDFMNILFGSLVMIFVLLILSFIIPNFSDVRMMNLLLILVYFVIAIIIYIFYIRFSGLKSIHFVQEKAKKLKSSR